MRRARWPLLLAPVAALVPAVAGAAPAGPGTPPPLRAGQVLASYYPHRTSVFPTAAARDAAGRIVATGTFSPLSGNGIATSTGVAVARFAATGQADLSFGSAGASTSLATGTIAPDQRLSVQVVTPLPDGGLLVGGSAAGRVFVERFAADGTLDPSFGTGGIVRGAAASAAFSEPRALAVTPLADGTIVFVHTEPQPQSAGAADVFPGGLLIDRLGPNGAQLSHETYGAREWTAGTSTGYAAWVAAHVYGDGSVLVAGSMTVPFTLPCPCPIHLELVLRKFHADGSVNASFGAGGRVTTRMGSDTYGQSLAVGDDGTIVVGGTSGSGGGTVAAARYRSDGSLDPTFGQDGTATVAGGDGNVLALGADGSVFLGSSQSADLNVVQLGPNGTPVAEFGSNGRATTTGGGRVAGLFPKAAGGVEVVVGHGNGEDFGLVRYTSTGVVDSAFGAHSILVGLPPPAGALAVATTATGTVVAAGFAQDDAGSTGMHVALLSRGLPSKTFGTNGEVTVFAGRDARATTVGIDPEGRIVAGGSSSDGTVSRWLVARFRPDGTLDPGFGVSGFVGSPETGATDGVAGLAVLPDSRVLLLVRQGGRELVVRLAADGSPDRGFGDAGQVAVPIPGADALAPLPGGGAVVAGDGLACAWIDARGLVTRRSDPAISSGVAAGVAVQRDGAIVVAGTTPAGIAVARRLPDGTLDNGFGNGSLATRTDLDASGIAVQRDGRIDVAVRSRTASQLGVLRFFATGGVDTSFGRDGLAGTDDGGITHAIAVLQGGIIVAGTAPAPRGTDFAMVMLYQDSHVAGVIGTLFHVTPKGVARRIARDATQPAWSRAAGLLAYVSDDDGAPGISVRRGNAGRRIADSPLPSGAVVVGDPQWSRDGTLLALRVLDAEGTPSVAVLGAAGGPLRRMVAAPGAGWTAGHDLVYATAADEIRIVDVDTGAVRRVTTGSQVRPAPVGSLLAVEKGAWTLVRPDGTIVSRLPPRFYDPGWAPDGRRLAGLDHGRLVVVDLKGHERRLTAHAGEEARAPTWSPDGRLIAFVNRTGESYVVEFVDVRSGKPVERWRPGGAFEGADPSWDATGVYIPNA